MDTNSVEKELPMILFFTGSNCSHCINFRGVDGLPSKDFSKKWNLSYIRQLLNYPGSNFEKHNAEIIVELHFNGYDKIIQVNIFSLIPTINEIKSNKLFNPNRPGSGVEHIAITRGPHNIVNVNVNVNGEYDKELTDIYSRKYIWDSIPNDIIEIRNMLKNEKNITFDTCRKIKDETIKNFVLQNMNMVEKNIGFLDSYILRLYDYDLFLKKHVAKQICYYKEYVPCWMLLLKREWNKSIEKNTPVYARVVNNKTVFKNNKYSIVPFSSNETIETLLEKYHSSEMKLEYSEPSKLKKIYGWQNNI